MMPLLLSLHHIFDQPSPSYKKESIHFILSSVDQNKFGSNSCFPSIRYGIANFFNADFDSFNSNEISLLLYSFLIRFWKDSRASSTTFCFFLWYVIQQPVTKICDLLHAVGNAFLVLVVIMECYHQELAHQELRGYSLMFLSC